MWSASTTIREQNVSARLTSCVTAMQAVSVRRFLAKQAETLQLLIDVEKGRRLVEEQQPGRLRQAGGQQHALPLAAAERGDPPVAELAGSPT